MTALVIVALPMVLAPLAVLRLRLRTLRRRVADAVHEVRGPLTAAGLALEAAARRGAIAPDRAAGIDAQLLRARRALEDLTAAPTGGLPRDRLEPLHAQDVLDGCVAGWTSVAAAAGRELRVSGTSQALVLADPVRLAQATGNLLANALEHGAGRIDVSLRERGGRIRIEVRDGGPGLGASLPTTAARSERDPRGRGLAIVAAIAERHGGRLVAAPSASGAALAIELPALPPGAQAAR